MVAAPSLGLRGRDARVRPCPIEEVFGRVRVAKAEYSRHLLHCLVDALLRKADERFDRQLARLAASARA